MNATNPHEMHTVQKLKGVIEGKHGNRLYVGNLDHRLTEYQVIKMFSPFGKICFEEFMWHRHGPRKGEPRGFAFIEFSKREEAENAKESMNGRLALGRPLVVRFVDGNSDTHSVEASQQSTKPNNPNISYMSSCTVSKSSKIAAIQNKLKSMEQTTSIGPVSPNYSIEQSKVSLKASKSTVKSSVGPTKCV